MSVRTVKIRKHLRKHKEAYIVGGVGLGLAYFTWYIMRDHSRLISSSVTGTAGHSVTVTGKSVEFKNNTLNMVSYISAERSGPPSWVVRCIETGQVYTSQRAAALSMEISETNISKHLNGLQETAQGFTFERLCMAA